MQFLVATVAVGVWILAAGMLVWHCVMTYGILPFAILPINQDQIQNYCIITNFKESKSWFDLVTTDNQTQDCNSNKNSVNQGMIIIVRLYSCSVKHKSITCRRWFTTSPSNFMLYDLRHDGSNPQHLVISSYLENSQILTFYFWLKKCWHTYLRIFLCSSYHDHVHDLRVDPHDTHH